MKCDDCQELFSLYFDGEIDPVSRSEVDSHFAVCPRCKMEWHAFRNTTTFLRDMPCTHVPPDFLAGIHVKLETRSSWHKLVDFFSGRNEQKWAYSTAFATLLIGAVTVSLTQFIPITRTLPISPPQAITQSDQIAAQTAAVKPSIANTKNEQTDFYPGVPLLSEYKNRPSETAGSFTTASRSRTEGKIPVVDFVSTGSGHSSSPYLYTPFNSFGSQPQAPTIKPDLQITIHSEPGSNDHMEIVRRIVQSQLWRSELYDHNTLLLSVPAANFNNLLQMCGNPTTSLFPEYAGNSHYISLKRFVTVAIRVD